MLDVIKKRSSVRKYKSTQISEDIILDLIESARLAPSGNNTQPWHFITVLDDSMRQKISEVSHNQKWMLTAPLFIVCIADLSARTGKTGIAIDENSPDENVKKIIRDTAIAVEHIVLNAVQHGLGTCWVAWYSQNDMKNLLKLPFDKYVLCVLTVGYPDQEDKPRSRKALGEILHYEKW
ncbi:MAG: nitroreductase family protein [Spirochaetes bacterium]|nr:nitroreductase family protein [Spirochaetota bacterium]